MRNKQIYIIVLLILFLIPLGFIAYKNVHYDNPIKQEVMSDITPEVIPTVEPTGAIISLEQVQDDREDYVLVGVRIDSKEHKVSGYDVVLEYDSKVLQPVNYEKKLEDFEVFTNSKDNIYSIGGVRKLNSGSSEPISNETVGTLELKRLNKDSTTIKVLYVPNSTKDSNVIDDNSQDVLKGVKEIFIK